MENRKVELLIEALKVLTRDADERVRRDVRDILLIELQLMK